MFSFCGHASVLPALLENLVRLSSRDAFEEFLVAHHHWRGAATGEAFDELDEGWQVLRRVRRMPRELRHRTRDDVQRGVPRGRLAREGGRNYGEVQMNWLPDMDLNHDKQIQSLLCYRYTIGHSGESKNLRISFTESSR